MRAAFLVALAGCYSPQPVPGAPCSAEGTCPTGLVCVGDRCVLPGTSDDARVDDGPIDAADAMIDASIDAPPDVMLDAPTGLLPVLVQQAFKFQTPGTQVAVSFNSMPTVGNVIVAIGGCPSASLASIAGGAVTWQRVVASTVHPNVEVFVGISNGEKTVTVSLPTCASQISLSISEWDRVANPPLDKVSADNGLASPASAGSIMTTGAPRLVLFSVANYTPNTVGTPTDGPWSQLLPINDLVEIRTWYRVVGAGTVAPTVSETHHEWDAALVSLIGE